MSVSITVRNVPEETLSELAARAAVVALSCSLAKASGPGCHFIVNAPPS